MTINIAPATKADLPACEKIAQTRELAVDEKFITAQDLEDYLNSDTSIFLVAKKDDEVVGFLVGYFHNQNSSYLSDLCVREDMRHLGIGSKLIKTYQKQLKEKGLKTFWLITHDFNENAQSFYANLGLKPSTDKFFIYCGDID